MSDREDASEGNIPLPPIPNELPPVPSPRATIQPTTHLAQPNVVGWLIGLVATLVVGLIGFAIWSFSLLNNQKAHTLDARTEAQALAEGKMSADQRAAAAESMAQAAREQALRSEREKEELLESKMSADQRAAAAESMAQAAREQTLRAEREKEELSERSRLAAEASRAPISSGDLYGSEILSFEEAEQRADLGDAYAQAIMAIYYATGYKVEKNLVAAAEYAMRSAKQGHPLGIYRLGVMIENGDALEQNAQLGSDLKTRAIAGLDSMVGDPYAMTSLGIMLWRGQGVAQNKALAANLYQRAADMGYAPAEYNFAACLLSGQGVRKNQAEGMRYWQRAVQQNYPLALEGPPL
jgi:TPR repeat protein